MPFPAPFPSANNVRRARYTIKRSHYNPLPRPLLQNDTQTQCSQIQQPSPLPCSNTDQLRSRSAPLSIPRRQCPAFPPPSPSRTPLLLSHASIILLIRLRPSKVPVVSAPCTGPPGRRSESLPIVHGPDSMEVT